MLDVYLEFERHDAVLLTFNPAQVAEVRQGLRVPIHCLRPTFFHYSNAVPGKRPRLELMNVGSLGPHHP